MNARLRPTRHCERLRQKISLLLPELEHASQRLVTHANVRDLYPDYLAMMHGVIRASVPLMQAAVDRSRAIGENDPVATLLADYLAKHIPEELHHDVWLLEDLEALGKERSIVLARRPAPTVAAVVGAQYYWIFHYHPVAVLGYIGLLEGYPPTNALMDELMARTGYGAEAFRTMRAHAALDPGHREEFEEVLDGLPLTPEQSAVIGLSAMYTVHTMARAIDEVVGDA